MTSTQFVLTYAADHDPDLPPFIRGALTPRLVADYERADAATLRPCWDDAQGRYVFGDDLFYVSREDTVCLDFYPVADGFLASERLLTTLVEFAQAGVCARDVGVVDEGGRANSANAMKFCQVTDVRLVCEHALMDIDGEFHPELDGPNRVDATGPSPVLTAAMSIALKPGLPHLMATREIPALTTLVSRSIKQACEERAMRGPASSRSKTSSSSISPMTGWPVFPGQSRIGGKEKI